MKKEKSRQDNLKKAIRKANKDYGVIKAKSVGEKITLTIAFIFMMLWAFVLLYPLLWLVLMSFKGVVQYNTDMALNQSMNLPSPFHWENYVNALKHLQVRGVYLDGMLFNSVWYMVITVAQSTFLHVCTGYVFAKYEFKGKNFLYNFVIIAMIIPVFGTGGAMFEFWYKLGMYDNPLHVVLSNCAGFGMHFLVFRGFFKGISWDYAEAVLIDGGNDFTVFFKIMIPMAVPMIATMSIMRFIGAWNAYGEMIMYLPSYPTLATGIFYVQSTIGSRYGNYPEFFAAATVATLPVLITFFFAAPTIMKNYTIGGLKG